MGPLQHLRCIIYVTCTYGSVHSLENAGFQKDRFMKSILQGYWLQCHNVGFTLVLKWPPISKNIRSGQNNISSSKFRCQHSSWSTPVCIWILVFWRKSDMSPLPPFSPQGKTRRFKRLLAIHKVSFMMLLLDGLFWHFSTTRLWWIRTVWVSKLSDSLLSGGFFSQSLCDFKVVFLPPHDPQSWGKCWSTLFNNSSTTRK